MQARKLHLHWRIKDKRYQRTSIQIIIINILNLITELPTNPKWKSTRSRVAKFPQMLKKITTIRIFQILNE